MEKNITFKCPLYLTVDDIKILLRREKSFCYDYMKTLRILYPDRCKNGKNIPSNVFSEYTGNSLEDIAEILEASKRKI
ncbi:hypothetical protein LV89_00518 [Arcicella aurantiaca]|uniref:Uncharacterized protein n=1 Tax=Arcicella aurantiaca TaxID=591202 RepID=A0A316EHJ1_9BACT|nr:hypothetical protein LV89_00518 [Arcicella aurantiaca]